MSRNSTPQAAAVIELGCRAESHRSMLVQPPKCDKTLFFDKLRLAAIFSKAFDYRTVSDARNYPLIWRHPVG